MKSEVSHIRSSLRTLSHPNGYIQRLLSEVAHREFLERHVLIVLILTLSMGFGCIDAPDGPEKRCPNWDAIAPSAMNGPFWHPSGAFVAFNYVPLLSITYSAGTACPGEYTFLYDSAGVWAVDPDGTNLHRIFKYTLLDPAWSPDGQTIAFSKPGGDGIQVFTMSFHGSSFDTTSLIRLTPNGRNFYPSWSPDGQWIAFDNTNCDTPDSTHCGVFVIRPDGTQQRRIADGRMPSWTSDGKAIIYVGRDFEIHQVDYFDTSQVRQLTSLGSTTGYQWDIRNPRQLSNDGSLIFWGLIHNYSGGDGLWRITPTVPTPEKISSSFVDASFGLPYILSPDRSQVVYTRYNQTDITYENGDLRILDLANGMEKTMVGNPWIN